ncbi:putative nuclear RNA export factor SDE5 [Benincasa hispida]|uniref:putative nuclear RNA export factor SDE5 n=1 Tax=Benincasa hispida TaxID=102211 RepID=UPI0018FFDEB9|nr:putative nuclear RNA export factor SDE5 [Benincasa hispida]
MTGKETYGVSASKCAEEDVALKSLIDAFGSAFSLQEIASAYFEAGHKADLAGEILFQMQGSTSSSASNGEVRNGDNLAKGKVSERSYQVKGNLKTAKLKVQPFSTGTVSNIIGKEFACSKPSANKFTKVYKPVKVGVKVLHESSCEGDCTSLPSDFHLHHDMEDFLFKMLGDGFSLKREVIREVIGSCGYDMKKSMENLLNRSTTPAEERLGSGNKSTDMTAASCSRSDLISCQRNKADNHYTGGNGNMASSKKVLELTNLEKTRSDLQKEILIALFDASEEPEEESPRRTVPRRKQFKAYGQLVSEPFEDMDAEHEKLVQYKEQIDLDVEVEDEENSYQLLRKAVREYRRTMKEYYAAAIDAFAKGDSVRAVKLIDEGHFYHKKAQEADEQSNQLIFEPRNADTEEDEILLDLNDLGGREAVSVLKSQISSLSGIPSIKHLKVTMEADDKDTSKRSCRRLVMKLLEKESIEWTEEENGGSILIRLDTIDRKRLSFVKRMH